MENTTTNAVISEPENNTGKILLPEKFRKFVFICTLFILSLPKIGDGLKDKDEMRLLIIFCF